MRVLWTLLLIWGTSVWGIAVPDNNVTIHPDSSVCQEEDGSDGVPLRGSEFRLGLREEGGPDCVLSLGVGSLENCINGTNSFRLNSSVSKGDSDEVQLNCSAPYPIDIKFDGLFLAHPSLKIGFFRQLMKGGKRIHSLNASFPAEVMSTGNYVVYRRDNLSAYTEAQMTFEPKRSSNEDTSSGYYSEPLGGRPILSNVSSSVLSLSNRTFRGKPVIVCASEFENNVQRLVNVYASNPAEASYKSDCLFKNYRCFTKREGSLIQCRELGLTNYSCRYLDLKPPGGFVSCFTEGYELNYSITRKYYIGIDRQIHFKMEGANPSQVSDKSVIQITSGDPNPNSGVETNYTCKAVTFLLAKSLSWSLVAKNSTWELLQTDASSLWEDPQTGTVTSTISIRFSTDIQTVVCTGFFYNSDFAYNSTQDVNVIQSYGPKFLKKEATIPVDNTGIFSLSCEAFGVPPPKLVWKKDGELLKHNFSRDETSGSDFSKITLVYGENEEFPTGDVDCYAENILGNSTKTFHIVIKEPDLSAENLKILLGVALAIIITTLGVLVLVYSRYRKASAALTKAEIEEFKKGNAHPLDPEELNAIPQNVPYNEEYEINEKKLVVDFTNPEDVLGVGAFGLVVRGTYCDLPVAVKTLKNCSSKEELRSLLCELKVMQYIGEHPNISKLVGAMTKQLHLGKVYVLLELYPYGSLDKYLEKYRGSYVNQVYEHGESNTAGSTPAFTNECYLRQSDMANYANISVLVDDVLYTKDLVNWSHQIAQGMAYLNDICVIHGDLATRNILLADPKTIKISDFGLSRKQYSNFYAKKSQEPVPWRWMAIESLQYLVFSTESDIWAFGVTLWEIFTLAQVPYPTVAWTDDFKDALSSGLRLSKPEYASQEIYDLMRECWHEDPKSRIAFATLEGKLKRIYNFLRLSYPSSTTDEYL